MVEADTRDSLSMDLIRNKIAEFKSKQHIGHRPIADTDESHKLVEDLLIYLHTLDAARRRAHDESGKMKESITFLEEMLTRAQARENENLRTNEQFQNSIKALQEKQDMFEVKSAEILSAADTELSDARRTIKDLKIENDDLRTRLHKYQQRAQATEVAQNSTVSMEIHENLKIDLLRTQDQLMNHMRTIEALRTEQVVSQSNTSCARCENYQQALSKSDSEIKHLHSIINVLQSDKTELLSYLDNLVNAKPQLQN